MSSDRRVNGFTKTAILYVCESLLWPILYSSVSPGMAAVGGVL